MKLATKLMTTTLFMTMASFSAAGIVDQPAVGGDLVVTAAANTTDFVQTPFTYSPSSAVWVAAVQDAVQFVVAAQHTKGRYTYGGDSEGGRVSGCQATPDPDGFTAAPSPTLANPCNGAS